MPIEVELKARVADPVAYEASLDVQAAFVRDTHKYDVYFRRPDSPKAHLRLRCEGDVFTVTTKHKRLVGNVEVNEEIEFEVSDAHAFCRFVDRFGFEPFVVKRKRSRVYRAGRVTLELSEVEHLGLFIEIEILCDDESQVEAARQELAGWVERLGIPAEAIEPTPYIRLLRERHPVRYLLDGSDPDSLVREEPLADAGRQERLL